ncbi:hypothetical protein MNEG_2468 [Monoraphidium neglectum]|uniref:Uncharacterized protein n=1 Tax=Monoraphidium neglectum TaxID=145388 RepID=A0A0D2NL58_9CHLO|nr:hypothetical protein MNEG_2468 [Monoraphidium neglectum]KIZ05486.1 hypothetical protein MNEG_2468 [Monoraphidium neglectum]|eukprot:XP_013904505.1 hypothetical protein MNEG_2468 [Monoraphidium neglectum]
MQQRSANIAARPLTGLAAPSPPLVLRAARSPQPAALPATTGQLPSGPTDVAPDVLLSLQDERTRSGREASTSGRPGADAPGSTRTDGALAIVPRTRARAARALGAPGYLPGAGAAPTAAAEGGSAPGGAPGVAAGGAAGALVQHVVDGLTQAPWADDALRAEVAEARAKGQRCAARPDPPAALSDWLQRASVSRHWLAIAAAAAEAGGGVAALRVDALEKLIHALAGDGEGEGSEGPSRALGPKQPQAARGARGEAGSEALAAARSAVARAACERLEDLLQQGAAGAGPAPLGVERAASAALGSADGADASSAAGMLWGLARYQVAPAAPDAYNPLLLVAASGPGGLAPAAVHKALLAADRLSLEPPAGWAQGLLLGGAARLGEAASLWELVDLLGAAAAKLGPAAEGAGLEWREAFLPAALEVAARRAPPPAPARQQRRRDEPGQQQQQHDGDAGEVERAEAEVEDQGESLESWDQEGDSEGGRSQQRLPLLRGAEVCAFLSAAARSARWLRPTGVWVSRLLQAYGRCPPEPEILPVLLPLLPRLLRDPPDWARRNRRLLRLLAGGRAAEAGVAAATPGQLAELAEACAALEFGGARRELLTWHGSAVLRLGRGCPLDELVRIREAYISLKHWPREDRLRLLLTQAAGRMATIQRKRDEKLAIRRRVQLKQRSQLFAKIKRERLKRLRKLRFGQGWGATRRQAADAARGREVKATWAQRKLRPPGKMQRRF